MKSKSLQSIIDHQQLQMYPSTSQQNRSSLKQQHQQQSSTQHRIYHLSDEKINDIIFIEEAPKIKVINGKKILHDSNENLSKVLINRSNILPNHSEMKFITSSTNQIYQDQQSSLLTVFSTTASNLGLKITQQPSSQQQSSSSLLSTSPKQINMIERSNSNSKYPTIHNTNITSSLNRNNSSHLSNEMKKFIPGRSILTPQNTNQNSIQQSPQIVSIVKPIISNVFIDKNIPNSAGANSNNNLNLSTINKQPQQQSPTIVTRINNRSSIIRSNTDRSPSTLLSPVLYHQQQQQQQQQNFYNITSTNNNIHNNNNNNNNNNSNNNINTSISATNFNNSDTFQYSSNTTNKQSSFNNTSRNKSPNLLAREKTSLSNYFTNIMNPINITNNTNTNTNNNNNNNNSNTILNTNINNNNNNTFNNTKKLKQQQQQIFNSTITNNLIGKINTSRNELNSSLSSNNLASNLNNMLINLNNNSNSINNNHKSSKHANSFNYKYNLGQIPSSVVNNSNNSIQRSNSNLNFENDIITGVSLKSAIALRQKLNSNTSINDLNNTLNLNRNDSRLLDSIIHENNNQHNDSLNENDNLNETLNGLNSNINNNGMLSGRSNNKYSSGKRITKSKPVDKNSIIRQTSNLAQLNNGNYQPLIINSKKLANEDENNKPQTFDESLNFDANNNNNNEESKYSAGRNLTRNSRSSFKETSAKIFGSIIMPSKSTLTSTKDVNTNNNNNNNNQNNKRNESAKTYISRDINDSYAYNDVKKYIEENDLMPPDRAEFIRLWVRDVNMCLKELEQTVI